jgi:signal-transduction protein with cAMP-binding, CBS, and nucleotidyltransferase domain
MRTMTQKQASVASGRRTPVWIDPAADLQTAATRMASNGTSSILVGEPGQLVSILTERDVARAAARGEPPSTPVGAVAVPRPFTVDADATVHAAGLRMIEYDVRHLVVTRADQAIGVISMRDVLQAMLASAERSLLLSMVTEQLASRPEHWWG